MPNLNIKRWGTSLTQPIALKSMLNLRRGKEDNNSNSTTYKERIVSRKHHDVDRSVANHVQQNPFLRRYARLIDNLVVSFLPSQIDTTIVKTPLCTYPAEYLDDRVLCAAVEQ